MSDTTFDQAIRKIAALLAEAGITNFALVAFDPSNDGATGAACVHTTTPADTTAVFHSVAEAMFPAFAHLNGLPSAVAAEAMREVIYLAESAHDERMEAHRQFDEGFQAIRGVNRGPVPEG